MTEAKQESKNYRIIAARNTTSTASQLAVRLIVGLILPPFILTYLHIEAYATWALILALSNLVALGDVGTQAAIAKLIAEFSVSNKRKQISQTITAAFLLYPTVGLILLIGIFFGSRWIFPLFFRSEAIQESLLGRLLLWSLLVNLLNLLSYVLASVLNGLQRMDLTNAVQMLSLIASALAQIFGLVSGLGLYALALGLTASGILQFILSTIYFAKLLPDFSFYPSGLRKILTRMIKLSLGEIAVRFSGTIAGNLDKFLISFFVGVVWVGYYDLAFRLIAQIRMLPGSLFQMMIPLASELNALAERKRIQTLYAKSMQYLHLLAIPLFGFLFVFAYPIVEVWLGRGFEWVAVTIRMVIISSYLNLITGPSYALSLGLGQIKIGVRFSVFSLLLSCTVSPILIFLFHYFGALAGYVVTTSAASFYILVLFGRKNRLQPLREQLVSFLKPAVPTLCTVFLVAYVYSTTDAFRLGVNSLSLTLVATCFGILLVFLFRAYKILGREEMKLIRDILAAYPARKLLDL